MEGTIRGGVVLWNRQAKWIALVVRRRRSDCNKTKIEQRRWWKIYQMKVWERRVWNSWSARGRRLRSRKKVRRSSSGGRQRRQVMFIGNTETHKTMRKYNERQVHTKNNRKTSDMSWSKTICGRCKGKREMASAKEIRNRNDLTFNFLSQPPAAERHGTTDNHLCAYSS